MCRVIIIPDLISSSIPPTLCLIRQCPMDQRDNTTAMPHQPTNEPTSFEARLSVRS